MVTLLSPPPRAPPSFSSLFAFSFIYHSLPLLRFSFPPAWSPSIYPIHTMFLIIHLRYVNEEKMREIVDTTNLHTNKFRVSLDTYMLISFFKSMFQTQDNRSILSNIICRNAHPFTQSADLPRLRVRESKVLTRIQKVKNTSKPSVNCIPYFHLQHAAQLLPLLVQDFLLKHHQTPEYRNAGHKHGLRLIFAPLAH